MDIKITGFTEPDSWYRERIGDVFEILEESKDAIGNKIYIVEKGNNSNKFVDERDCVMCELSDADYIKELEGLVCFLAGCYEKTKETYFDKHMETCSASNPSRRDLTEAEQSEWQRFPMIQGTALQHIISDIAKANKPNPKDAKGLLKRFKKLF